jgi:hypothetical protein
MRRLMIAIAAIVGIVGAMFAAVPAFATCAPGTGDAVNACADVGETLTLSGLSNAVDFGTVTPTVTDTVTGAEAYSVSSNDPNGYALSVTPATDPCGGEGFYSGDAHCLPLYGHMAITETGTSGTSIGVDDWPSTNVNDGPQAIDTQTASGTFSYSEDWALTVPATEDAGEYNESFVYAVQAS